MIGSGEKLRTIVQTIDSQYGKEYNSDDYDIQHKSIVLNEWSLKKIDLKISSQFKIYCLNYITIIVATTVVHYSHRRCYDGWHFIVF